MSTATDWISAIAGAVAAFAFILLVVFSVRWLLKLGDVLEETRKSVKEITDHTIPILDEAATTIASTNDQLVKVDTITTAAAEVSENVSALTALYAATLGRPMVKVAAFSYGVRRAFSKASQPKGTGR